MPDLGANGKVAPCLGLFTLTAFALSLVATFSCEFINLGAREGSIGFWSAKSCESCTCYAWPSGASFNSSFTAARAFSVITVVIGLVLMVTGCMVCCLPFPAAMFKSLGVGYFFQTLFEGLKFLAVDGRNGYSLEYGANCCIAATVFWFVSMLMSCAVKPPDRDEDRGDRGEPLIEENADE